MADESEKASSEGLFTALSLVFIFVVGLGLGSTTTVPDFKHACKKPNAVCTGLASQYLFMHLFDFAVCKFFSVRDHIAV